ncbi:MAG: protein kinase [Polyangiaceae bacterium]
MPDQKAGSSDGAAGRVASRPARAEVTTGGWGPYVLGRRIGRGGMGVVHAAIHRNAAGIARLVAVKILLGDRADHAEERAAFLREARILARLDHPNVVRWLDAGEVDGDVFLAMELLHGASLAQIVAASPERIPWPIAIAVIADLARGLHAAHELVDETGKPLGLVHQDVSPQNAVVGYDGRTRLVDFGIARLASVDASRTDTVRGKPAYLAPEQLEGRRLDRRTDVFALGVTAFELLTGRRLFARASIAETHTAVLFEPIPDLRDVVPEAPADLAAVVACALARSPSGRFQTAEAFRRALVTARDDAGIPSADEHEIAALVRARVPPPWRPHELFAEIEGDPSARPETSEGDHEAPTVAPKREATGEDDATVAPKRDAEGVSENRDTVARRDLAPLPETAIDIPLVKAPRWPRYVLVAAMMLFVLGLLARRRFHARAPAEADAPVASAASGEPGPLRAQPSSGTEAPAAPSSATPIPRATIARSTSTAPAPLPSTSASIPGAAASATVALSASASTAIAPSASAPSSVMSGVVAEAPSSGWISVWSTPWGHVRIDGRAVGDSPVARVPAPPGSHTVTVKTDAGEQSRGVSVKPGEEAKVRFVF